MEKKSKANYERALEIYQEIRATEGQENNSEAIYGYATAYARYNEIQEEVLGAMISLMALVADLKSITPVTLFSRLYANSILATSSISPTRAADWCPSAGESRTSVSIFSGNSTRSNCPGQRSGTIMRRTGTRFLAWLPPWKPDIVI